MWEASIGEELPCQRESGNIADPFAVAVVRVSFRIWPRGGGAKRQYVIQWGRHSSHYKHRT